MGAAFLERLDERQQRLLIVGAFVLLVAVCFAYVILPALKSYRQALTSMRVIESVVVNEQSMETELERLAAEVAALDRELHGDTANLAENQLEAFVVGRLQSISWRNGVELLSVEPRIGDTIQMFRESLFEIRLSGDYFALFAWLNNVRDELGFVVIKEYEMRPTEDVARDPTLEARLVVASYRVDDA